MPSSKLLKTMAEVLDCNPLALMDVTGQNVEELMTIFFWIEEDHPGMFHAFQLQPIQQCDEENETADDANLYFHDGDSWPAHAPCGLWIDNNLMNGFFREWLYHQQELKAGSITKEEYFEWKINWPYTCDECGKREPAKRWRKENAIPDIDESGWTGAAAPLRRQRCTASPSDVPACAPPRTH